MSAIQQQTNALIARYEAALKSAATASDALALQVNLRTLQNLASRIANSEGLTWAGEPEKIESD